MLNCQIFLDARKWWWGGGGYVQKVPSFLNHSSNMDENTLKLTLSKLYFKLIVIVSLATEQK